MRELKYKLDHGLFVEKEKITLDEWNKTWMEQYKKNRVKNSTYNSYQKYYKGAISKRLGKKNIADIRGEHIQSLYNNLVEEEMGAFQYQGSSGSFKWMFSAGIEKWADRAQSG